MDPNITFKFDLSRNKFTGMEVGFLPRDRYGYGFPGQSSVLYDFGLHREYRNPGLFGTYPPVSNSKFGGLMGQGITDQQMIMGALLLIGLAVQSTLEQGGGAAFEKARPQIPTMPNYPGTNYPMPSVVFQRPGDFDLPGRYPGFSARDVIMYQNPLTDALRLPAAPESFSSRFATSLPEESPPLEPEQPQAPAAPATRTSVRPRTLKF